MLSKLSHKNIKPLTVALAGCLAVFSTCSAAFPQLDQDILDEVRALHNITESEVVERLASEARANRVAQQVASLDLQNYAGSWFDPDTNRLKVALSSPSGSDLIQRLGADVEFVTYSLAELRQQRAVTTSQLRFSGVEDMKSYIEFENNKLVVFVPASSLEFSESIASADVDGLVELRERTGSATFSSSVRAADGTRNATWNQQFPNSPTFPHPCSVGASVVETNTPSTEGFVYNGHCGRTGHDIETPSGTALGEIDESTYNGSGFTNNVDSAWVDTTSAWTPEPEVNGYNDGIFDVSSEWGGNVQAAVNTTVCRYGQTSGGPDCGTIDAHNVDDFVGGLYIEGMTEASGICTDDGDSGGPYLTTSDQMQGTNIGGSPGNTCPTPANFVYYTPINDSLDEFDLTMKTPHGQSSPISNNSLCPHPGNSGQGTYWCEIDSYDSQGSASISWTSNTGHSSTNTVLVGSCYSSQTVNVDLELTNSYGTTTESYSFSCPTGPRP